MNKKIFISFLCIIMVLGNAMTVFAQETSGKTESVQVVMPRAEVCGECNKGILISNVVYTGWGSTGEQKNCTHYPYGTDLLESREALTTVTCNYCHRSHTYTSATETRWACHGYR